MNLILQSNFLIHQGFDLLNLLELILLILVFLLVLKCLFEGDLLLSGKELSLECLNLDLSLIGNALVLGGDSFVEGFNLLLERFVLLFHFHELHPLLGVPPLVVGFLGVKTLVELINHLGLWNVQVSHLVLEVLQNCKLSFKVLDLVFQLFDLNGVLDLGLSLILTEHIDLNGMLPDHVLIHLLHSLQLCLVLGLHLLIMDDLQVQTLLGVLLHLLLLVDLLHFGQLGGMLFLQGLQLGVVLLQGVVILLLTL